MINSPFRKKVIKETMGGATATWILIESGDAAYLGGPCSCQVKEQLSVTHPSQ